MGEQNILKYRFDSVKNWSTENKAEELFNLLGVNSPPLGA